MSLFVNVILQLFSSTGDNKKDKNIQNRKCRVCLWQSATRANSADKQTDKKTKTTPSKTTKIKTKQLSKFWNKSVSGMSSLSNRTAAKKKMVKILRWKARGGKKKRIKKKNETATH